MNGKNKLIEKCKVVCICDADFDSGPSIEAGDTFQYRGESPRGVHQFGPDYDRYGRVGGLIGFQINESDMGNFYDLFRVLSDDNI